MREIARTPLDEIRQQEDQSKAKDAQLQQLSLSLAQEKAKSAQKDIQISQLGQQIAVLKMDVAKLKGSDVK